MRQAHPAYLHFEDAPVLEEIQMLEALALGVLDGMHAGNPGIAKSAACNEVNGDVELPLSSIEVNTSDIPRCRDTEGGLEQLIRHSRLALHG